MDNGNFIFFFFLNKNIFLSDLALIGHDNFVGFFPNNIFFIFSIFLFSFFFIIFFLFL